MGVGKWGISPKSSHFSPMFLSFPTNFILFHPHSLECIFGSFSQFHISPNFPQFSPITPYFPPYIPPFPPILPHFFIFPNFPSLCG